jgi:hypothetical protein
MAMSFSESWNQTFPYAELPEGTVRITSDFDDGTRGTSRLVFGGNRSMPTERYTRDLQFSNDLSLLQPIGNQIHRLKARRLGAVLQGREPLDGQPVRHVLVRLARGLLRQPAGPLRALADGAAVAHRLAQHRHLHRRHLAHQHAARTHARPALGPLATRPEAAYNPLVEQLFGRRTDMDPVARRSARVSASTTGSTSRASRRAH